MIPPLSFIGLVILFPASGHILDSGTYLNNPEIKNESKPNPILIPHYSIVRPSLWQFNGKLPNVTIITWSTIIIMSISINNLDFNIPSKTFFSSDNFLLLKKFMICNQTNILNTSVKCLDGPYSTV